MARSSDIRTRRLLITPFSEAFLTPRYLGWLNDRDLMRFSNQRYLRHTEESCRIYLRSFEDTPNFFWAIVESGLGHIGNINAYVDTRNAVADIGVMIGERAAQSQKFGLESWLGVCGFLFIEGNLRKVTGGAAASNTAMLRLMRSAGMVEDGIRRKQLFIDGKAVDIVHMALFREQWPHFSDPIGGV